MTGAVESDAMTTYDVALADDCYRWSCSTFAAWTVLMLAFQRDALAERGVESIVFTFMGLLQTVMSYLGDVVYLKRGAKGEQFYPDVVLATGLIGWACRLHGSEPADATEQSIKSNQLRYLVFSNDWLNLTDLASHSVYPCFRP